MSKKPPGRGDHLRSAIAQEAARLMAEHGIQDFLLAKRKAAERYGVAEGAVLPSNAQIEAALAAHHRLFGGQQHAEGLVAQRRVAMQAMQLLTKFDPRLVGSVLSGTATEHADIQLHVFTDNPESVYMHLMDRRYDYDVVERRVRMQAERPLLVPAVRFRMGTSMVETLVFPTDGIRQPPVSPVDGKPMRRAGMAELAGLIGAPR